jgi:hypothetical protein
LAVCGPDWAVGQYAIVCENGVDLVGRGLEQALKELPSGRSVSCCNQLRDGELGCAVDSDEQAEHPFAGLHLRDADMKEPDGIALELLALWLVALDLGQVRDAVMLQAQMQRRPGEVRDRGLQGIEAVV